MKSAKQLHTPVLFLIFNRLDTTKRVFAEIRKANPPKLFVASDGPRSNKPGEDKLVEEVRKYVLSHVDWDCEVKTLFRKDNLGCRYAVSGAVTWFFRNVSEGIILEDDCLPKQSFFKFCEEMLKKYRNDSKIMSISGYNYVDHTKIAESYYFSRYFECIGWASWRRSWKQFDITLSSYKKMRENNTLKKIMPNLIERIYYSSKFEDVLNGRISSWAYCFTFAHFKNKGLAIYPKESLIQNIGFDERATHTKRNSIDEEYMTTKTKEMDFPLIHPQKIEFNKRMRTKWIIKEIKRIILKKIYSIFYKK